MTRTTHQQVLETINRATHTLICFPEAVSGDGVATSLGLARAIEALHPGHQVDVVSSGFTNEHRARYTFLPDAARVRSSIDRAQRLTIRIPCDGDTVCDIRHRPTDGAVEIEVEPKGGVLAHEHIETALREHTYDLIIVVDCPDLSMLGALYRAHAPIFQTTAILAIDHRADHERYAQVHLIDLTAAACGEVVAEFLRACAPSQLDADTATCLLAGILAKTKSFRSPTMATSTFAVSSALLDAGARRDEVVAALFRTRTLAQLQLWGRALSRLRTDPQRNIVWTLCSPHDFLTTRANPDDLPEVVDELLVNAPDAELVLLFSEHRNQHITVHAHAPSGRYDAVALLRPFGGAGTARAAHAALSDRSLIETERLVLDHIRRRIDAPVRA